MPNSSAQQIKGPITLTYILKRDGSSELFNLEKLKRSVSLALTAVGVKDNPISSKVAEEVIKKIRDDMAAGGIPSTLAIREAVEVALRERGLGPAADAYQDFFVKLRQNKQEKNDLAISSPSASKSKGLQFTYIFSDPDQHPFDQIEWEKRSAKIASIKGEVIFEQNDVEVPKFWSQNATNIVASKYFYGDQKKSQRENSARQLIDRVSRTITDWGKADKYFINEESAETFYRELTWLILNQYGTFNSPVWFNCGVHRYDKGSGVGRHYWNKEEQTVKVATDDYIHPQCSACFILSIEDTMDSILDLAKTEGMIFKFGSGSGVNLSPIRSSKENLSGGGQASGPVSFMKGYDAFAGVIKSGGKTRRAAKMVILNIDHPDVVDFIEAKVKEEKKAWALIDAGYDGAIDGEAYTSIFFQNANHSVRVTDEFMRAAEKGDDYWTKTVKDGRPLEKLSAREVLRKIATGTHLCGDPGLQYDSIINDWHTCIATDRIYASNPCSEYMFLNDTACNLSSLNLMKFRNEDCSFNAKLFDQAVRVFITAMEIIVDNASYPTEAMARNSHLYRTLGLGYANLGALLMSNGLAYDSDAGRGLSAAITAIMTGAAYEQSGQIAEVVGPFPGFTANRASTIKVMEQHLAAVDNINIDTHNQNLVDYARHLWQQVVTDVQDNGLRNAQATVLAPTGTIAFMMDCDTTGVEPDIALVKYKKLVGGGYMKIVNSTVSQALTSLGYTPEEIGRITEYIDKEDTIEGAPGLAEQDLSVFDCAFKPAKGKRFIYHLGHIKMMSAVQPFISGAISKTVNMPESSTVEEIMDAYIQGWKLGLKALAIYRDNSKRTQPLNTNKEDGSTKEGAKKQADLATAPVDYKPRRHRLPDERKSITHKFVIGGHSGYITVGLYPDGAPGEIFVTIAKDGSVISGLMDSFATTVSLALQYGVPLKVLVNQFAHRRFEPSGYTNNPQIKIAKSFVDYIFRWLALKFLSPEEAEAVGVKPNGEAEAAAVKIADNRSLINGFLETKDEPEIKPSETEVKPKENLFSSVKEVEVFISESEQFTFDNQADAPTCSTCGEIMVRNASCYKCMNCGATSGCS